MKIPGFRAVIDFIQKPTILKIGSSIFSQSAISLSYFLLGISIAKYASKSEYGLYVIFFSIVEMVGNFQAALITVPLTVLAPKKEPQEKDRFISGLGTGQFVIITPILAVALLGISLHAFTRSDYALLHYSLILSVTILANMLWEFVRTVHYSKLRTGLLVTMDMFFVVFIGVTITVLIALHRVTSTASLEILAAGYFFSALLGLYSSREKYAFQWKSILAAFKETWAYSRWALVGTTSDLFKNQSYIYIVSARLGLDAVAEISAARMFMRPVSLFLTSSGRISLAKGAEIVNAEGLSGLKKFAHSFMLFLLFIWASYVCALWISYDYLISFLGDKYRSIGLLIVLWTVFNFFYILRYTNANALLVCKDFKTVAKFGIYGAAITVTLCLTLTPVLHGAGALFSLIACEFVLLLLVSGRLLSLVRREKILNSSQEPLDRS